MSVQTKMIHQTLIDEDQPPIRTFIMLESTVTEELVQEFLASATTFPRPIRIGLCPAYSSSGHLCALALSTTSQTLIIQFHSKGKAESAKIGREILHTKVLCEPDCTLFAFDLGLLATSLFKDHGLRMLQGVDIQSACSGADSPLAAIQFAAGDRIAVHPENIMAAFEPRSWDPSRTTTFALVAWIASYLPTIPDMEERFNSVKRVNTQKLDDAYLDMIARMVRSDHLVARPLTTAHEFSHQLVDQQKAKLKSDRFQTRIRKSKNVNFTVLDESGAEYQVHGRTVDISGREATLKADRTLEGKTITALVSADGNRLTHAERRKSSAILQALQGEADILGNPFLKYMLSPTDDFTWPENFELSDSIPAVISTRLNDSQYHAVEQMLSDSNSTRITVIQGPPGTGKTTVIAAFVCSAVAAGRAGIWLVAQTNVAVKNIAEKLADVDFVNFKILVSADFHLGWHEHLYTKLNNNIIRSDEFRSAERQLEGCPVVLCTLSMLSNPRLKDFTPIVPITTLVIDEASQIAVQDYIPPLSLYNSVGKICFIGDDKQLPPYGQDSDEDVKSVFEITHLREKSLLLDIQYRMPPHIGDFISMEVYDSQLASNPLHPVKESLTYFVDVENSKEKRFQTSWTNLEECKAVVKIAAKLQEDNKSYRIITPYDAQRNLLQNEMKNQGLKWQDKCFNIDSFQGNEDDYIIISLVRSNELGFLSDVRRMNVMLTRCKRGMYICTGWDFIWGIAQDTLVGKMAIAWGEEAWKGAQDFETNNF